MAVKWNALAEQEKRKFEKMNEAQRFVYFLLKQYGAPYGWGKENPETSDCSGAVCMALYAATGLLIRTTADDLLKRVFTVINPKRTDIRAVFYITKKDKRHGDGYAAAGTATHVAGIVGDGVILNSQEPCAMIRQIYEVSDYFQKEGHEVLIRGLNREALEKLAREGKTRYGLDSEFSNYFDMGC